MSNESYTEGAPWLEDELNKEQKEKSSKVSPLFAILAGVAGYLVSIFFTQIFISSNIPYGYHLAMIVAEATLGIVPLYLVSMKYKDINVIQYMKVNGTAKTVILGVLAGVALVFVGTFLTYVLYVLIGPSEALEEVNKTITNLVFQSTTSVILLAIGLGSAGIWEEILFRGLILRSLEDKYNFRVAQITSSLLFGLAHFDPSGIYIIVTFVYGLIIAELYKRYNSLLIAIFTHATLNLTELTLLLLYYSL